MNDMWQKFEIVKQAELSYEVLLDGEHIEEFSDEASASEYVSWFSAKLRAAYEAGELAMKEKAAELRESLKLICAEAESWHTMHDHDGNGLVQCDSICALIPRMKAALSGAEDSERRNAVAQEQAERV